MVEALLLPLAVTFVNFATSLPDEFEVSQTFSSLLLYVE